MKPNPTSARSERGGTPQFDVAVTVRLRARNETAARERIERWADDLISFDSIEEVLVGAPVGVDPETGNLLGEE